MVNMEMEKLPDVVHAGHPASHTFNPSKRSSIYGDQASQ